MATTTNVPATAATTSSAPPPSVPASKANPADTFVILVATDQHLGFMEKDPNRKHDSFRSFEEILELGGRHKVDLILFGGDLFHENKPSRPTVVRTMELLRKYTWSDRPVQFEILSNARTNFPPIRFDEDKVYAHPPNFMDPNINVGVPVFAIHGNHDDPSGEGGLCALDMLHASGMLNYFGKQERVDQIVLSPILLKKGATKFALYGLGSVRDERLYHTCENQQLRFDRVPTDNNEEDGWFNLLVVHQNRVRHGTQYLPEVFLPDFLHLIMWGHEHECIPEVSHNTQTDFYVLQPGSSVATSLSEGESKKKHAFIIKINGTRFKTEKFPLKTVRPFVMQDIILSKVPDLKPENMDGVKEFLKLRVVELIDKARADWARENPEDAHNPAIVDRLKPLVRLKVEITGFTNFNVQQFGQAFVDRVANPQDILIFYRKRVVTRVRKTADGSEETMEEEEEGGFEDDLLNRMALRPIQLDATRMDDLVSKYLKDRKLDILPEAELADAVRQYVEKEESNAIKDFVDRSLDTVKKALSHKPEVLQEEPKLRQELERLKDEQQRRFLDKKMTEPQQLQVSKGPAKRVRRTGGDDDDGDEGDAGANFDGEENEDEDRTRRASSSKSRTGTSRGRRGTGATSTTRGRGGLTRTQAIALASTDSMDVDDVDMPAAPKRELGRGRGGSRAPSSSVTSKSHKRKAHDSDEHENNMMGADDDDDDIEFLDDGHNVDIPSPPKATSRRTTTAPSQDNQPTQPMALLSSSSSSTLATRKVPAFFQRK